MDAIVRYKRRSQDREDEQIASIQSQNRTLDEIPLIKHLSVLADFEESQSAKKPGRPKFNEMCKLIEQGKAKSIVCYHLNRLARNPVDGGRIIWLVQHYNVTVITPHKVYDVNDLLLMYVEFGMSNQFITDLRKSTARGVDDKLISGIAPVYAPIGYVNDITKKQGLRDILVDDLRFSIVRKMWEYLLHKQYSVPKILKIATEQWGLRHRNGKPLSRSQAYLVFSNIFYTGKFIYGGKEYQGVHKPMITLEEYRKAQIILGRHGKVKLTKHTFPFTNLMKCICGSAITAEERFRKICPACHHKYNGKVNNFCPRCKNPAPEKISYFAYYRCTKTMNPQCKQPHIPTKEIENQINEILDSLTIPQSFINWTMKKLRNSQKIEIANRETVSANLQNVYSGATKRLDNLSLKYFSEGNKNGELVSDDEYKKLKVQFLKEQKDCEEKIQELRLLQENWIENTEKIFNFAKHAKEWFAKDDSDQKRAIASALGTSFIIIQKKLYIELIKPFELVRSASKKIRAVVIEDRTVVQTTRPVQTDTYDYYSLTMGGLPYDVRTYFSKIESTEQEFYRGSYNSLQIQIPNFA